MNDEDLKIIAYLVGGVRLDEKMIETAKKDIAKHKLEDSIEEFSAKYSDKIREVLKGVDLEKKMLSKQRRETLEQVKLVLTKSEQKGFDKVIKYLKLYLLKF